MQYKLIYLKELIFFIGPAHDTLSIIWEEDENIAQENNLISVQLLALKQKLNSTEQKHSFKVKRKSLHRAFFCAY